MKNTLNEITKDIMSLASKKGFGTKPEEIELGEKFALLHTEVSEAYQAYRKNNLDGKNGFNEELADIILRTLHICGIYGIDIEKEIDEKMSYNKDREWDWDSLNEKHVK